MTRLKYALIGCGRRGRNHLNVVAHMRDAFEVVAVCDTDPLLAADAGARLKANVYQDIRALVDNERPDVCDVALPTEMHCAISCYLSSCGIHQNIETPLAPTLGQMDRMIHAASAHSVVLQTAENFPFLPVELFTGQLIRAGVIGPVHRCYRLFSSTWYHGLAAMRRRLGAWPIAVSSMAHTMPVTPYIDSAKRAFTSEDLEFYAVDYDNGSFGIALVGNKNGCLGRNTLAGFEVAGERGTIVTNGNQGMTGGEAVYLCTDDDIRLRSARAGRHEFRREYSPQGALLRIWIDLPAEAGRLPDGSPRADTEWRNPFAGTSISEMDISLAFLLRGLAQAVQSGCPPAWSGEEGRIDRETMIAAQRSIRANRQPVALPLNIDPAEEEAFEHDFEMRFGIDPRERPETVLAALARANYKAW